MFFYQIKCEIPCLVVLNTKRVWVYKGFNILQLIALQFCSQSKLLVYLFLKLVAADMYKNGACCFKLSSLPELFVKCLEWVRYCGKPFNYLNYDYYHR